jgi:hypothetical protein
MRVNRLQKTSNAGEQADSRGGAEATILERPVLAAAADDLYTGFTLVMD